MKTKLFVLAFLALTLSADHATTHSVASVFPRPTCNPFSDPNCNPMPKPQLLLTR